MIIEYAWMCPYKQDSEYALDPKYAKILTMAYFSICKPYRAFWICQNMSWQTSGYILSSKYAKILNMAGFRIFHNRDVYCIFSKNCPQHL